jgi:hypothetical protein
MLFFPGAPMPWLLLSYQWKMLTVKASMFHLQCIVLSEIYCGKNAEAAENGHIFQPMNIFQHSVTYSRAAKLCSTPSHYNQAWSLLWASAISAF